MTTTRDTRCFDFRRPSAPGILSLQVRVQFGATDRAKVRSRESHLWMIMQTPPGVDVSDAQLHRRRSVDEEVAVHEARVKIVPRV